MVDLGNVEHGQQGCISQRRRKPKLIVESIVRQILLLRDVPKDIVAKVCLENV